MRRTVTVLVHLPVDHLPGRTESFIIVDHVCLKSWRLLRRGNRSALSCTARAMAYKRTQGTLTLIIHSLENGNTLVLLSGWAQRGYY